MSYEINLIEGERGKAHITSDDARTENALMFGVGRKVYNMDNSFEASMTDNNTVRITSGVFYDNGMFIRIDRDKYVEVTIENGLPGTYRNDLICIRYERNIQTQLESASIVVKKGETSETAAVDPTYTEGDVLDLEVHLDEFPLYRVSLDGLTPSLEPMFVAEDMMSNISLYEELVEHMQDDNNPAGSKHIPEGGEEGQVLIWKGDGEGEWGETIVNFTSNDDLVPTSYVDLPKMNTGEKISTLFEKVSNLFQNIRFAQKKISSLETTVGTTTTSEIEYSYPQDGLISTKLGTSIRDAIKTATSKIAGYIVDVENAKANKEWKYHGEVKNMQPLNLPEMFNELYIEVSVNNSGTTANYLIPKAALKSSDKNYHDAFYYNSSTYMSTRIQINLKTVMMGVALLNGTDYIATSVMKVYYR